MMLKKVLLLLILSLFFILTYAQVDEEESLELPEDTLTLHLEPCGCAKIDSLVNFALTKRHNIYKYGHAGPDFFDCSGLMYYTFKEFGIILGRSSRDQYLMGQKVSDSEIQKGDLVFFKRGKGVGHVGIVIQVHADGSYKFFHASNAKNGIRIDESTRPGYFNTYVGARRIIDCANNTIFHPSSEDSVSSTNITAPPMEITTKSNKVKTISYTIQSGDTLYSLARKYHTTVDRIMTLNKMHSTKLQIGQKLKIERK